MQKLLIRAGLNQLSITPGETIIIGRSPNCALVITDPRVSREQLRVVWGASGWLIEVVGKAPVFLGDTQIFQVHISGDLSLSLVNKNGPTLEFHLQDYGPSDVPFIKPSDSASSLPTSALSSPNFTSQYQSLSPAAHIPSQASREEDHSNLFASKLITANDLKKNFEIFLPFKSWLTSRELRSAPIILLMLYALSPILLLAIANLLYPQSHFANYETYGSTFANYLQFAMAIYFAPLWIAIFYYLIRPGKIDSTIWGYLAVVAAIEAVLVFNGGSSIIGSLEGSISGSTKNLMFDLISPGLVEEGAKALPILLLAFFVAKDYKLEAKMWMFLGAVSGVIFGSFEAYEYIGTAFTPIAIQDQTGNLISTVGSPAWGVVEIVFRSLGDALSHAVWAGFSATFIGFSANYPRRRTLLVVFGLAVPTMLHAVNDWSLSAINNNDAQNIIWILIQALSIFIFIAYGRTLNSIEKNVRHSAYFRGSSIFYDIP